MIPYQWRNGENGDESGGFQRRWHVIDKMSEGFPRIGLP